MVNADEFRPLTAEERALIQRLLSVPFDGRDEALSQIDTCKCRPIDAEHCGSLELMVEGDVPLIPGGGTGDTVLPVEGRVVDLDGIPLEVLLFHNRGRLSDLEIVVYSERMKQFPAADELELIVVPPR